MPTQPEIRSEEIQDIMHRTPAWLTRWGITILLLILVGVLTGAAYIAYPDTVAATLTIDFQEKPITIIAPASTTIRKMMVHNRSLVRKGETLLIWANGDKARAPVTGTVYLMIQPQKQPSVMAGDTLAVIVPANSRYRVRGKLPIEGSGKVEAGQRAVIQLDAYPHQEFGSLLGTVETISPIEANGYYTVQFSLLQGLVTQKGTRIDSHTYLRGKVSILTSERSLLSRIFEII